MTNKHPQKQKRENSKIRYFFFVGGDWLECHHEAKRDKKAISHTTLDLQL